MIGGIGLTEVTTDELKSLLRWVHNGTLPCPFDKSVLMAMGLEHIAIKIDPVCGLEKPAVRACLVVALSERMAFDKKLARLNASR